MTAGAGEGDLEIGIGLLAGLHAEHHRLAVLAHRTAAAIAVEHQLGALELLGEHLGGRHRGFLVTREREDDAALGRIALVLQLEERGDYHRHVELVVEYAASIDIAALDDGLEGIARPILRVRRDDVHMIGDDDRLETGVAAGPGDGERARFADRIEDDGRGREARLLEQARQIRGEGRHLMVALHRLEAHRGLEQVQRAIGLAGRRRRRERRSRNHQKPCRHRGLRPTHHARPQG